jgi:hypothetical protein
VVRRVLLVLSILAIAVVAYLTAPPTPSPGCMVYKSLHGDGQVCGIVWSGSRRSIMMMIADLGYERSLASALLGASSALTVRPRLRYKLVNIAHAPSHPPGNSLVKLP